MEAWAGVKLKNSAIYGIRVYRRGSSLVNHVDRSDTHIISAIINVAQKVFMLFPDAYSMCPRVLAWGMEMHWC